ncbi:malto-oligosyltrehalose trehalohydrolase [Candidatus Methylobacter oryzae]|uniref:Malto-oligosyltrehalose trehalohydrolase n=1 Tax=Candidatus Methylobacter oryzae TaxID=2497749 RepID=A0ABY3CC04_9GAMM|nr:malto-oligosyltrehalose trehalohydrolase [Candidatus Methylobacter oryzae]TRW97195.1 malto-oligosyltrehalose trehalohydrolase [Candidatus Methylobacter oryzae]
MIEQTASELVNARRFPVGAERMPGGVHFRVWAPQRKTVKLALNHQGENIDPTFPPVEVELQNEDNGYFSAICEQAVVGALYRFLLDDDSQPYPDPASRFQPQGPHGPSQVIDALTFAWTDANWPGVKAQGQVIYEMHIGTFTREGTWLAAAKELPELAALGVTVLEIMPVADFPGRFGWGYDGVNLFAPTRLYGTPDEFRYFVNQAHAVGLGVILDVVYNHLGPDGNYLGKFSTKYFTTRYECEWGDALNFDGPDSGPVRDYVLANSAYWIQEFHLDGLRIDATQQIFDSSAENIIVAIVRTIRDAGAPRLTFIIGENEPQDAKLLRPPEHGGFGIDALWNDDFHHAAMVAMTGRADAYYSDYRGTAQEFVSTLKRGFLYQGQWYSWQNKTRGTPGLDMLPAKFINFIQNHDQLANSGSGKRIHLLTSPNRYRALTALFLLAPQTPMLFQGQEFAATSPFFYFADHKDEIAYLVARGRSQFLAQFRSLATPEMQARLPDPGDPLTFTHSKLNLDDRYLHKEEYALHRDLLKLRRNDPVFQASQQSCRIEGAVLNADAFAIRFFGENPGDDRLLLINLSRDIHLVPAPEPLLAPPKDCIWDVMWASEDPCYGGMGMPPWPRKGNWHIQGESAVVLTPVNPTKEAVNHEQ